MGSQDARNQLLRGRGAGHADPTSAQQASESSAGFSLRSLTLAPIQVLAAFK